MPSCVRPWFAVVSHSSVSQRRWSVSRPSSCRRAAKSELWPSIPCWRTTRCTGRSAHDIPTPKATSHERSTLLVRTTFYKIALNYTSVLRRLGRSRRVTPGSADKSGHAREKQPVLSMALGAREQQVRGSAHL
eukprot:6926571-Prymnesium_polylepis.2